MSKIETAVLRLNLSCLAFVMRVTLTLIPCLFAMVALVTSTKGNFEGSGKHKKATKDHAPILLEHESHAEDEGGSAFDSGSGAVDSGQ